MKDIGKRIKYFRQKLGLSQFELSQRSNISQASIARIETDKQKNLKSKTIEKLAAGLKISLYQLIEEPETVKEERAFYSNIRMVPVIKSTLLKDVRELQALPQKVDIFEPSFSADPDAFYVMVTENLASSLSINKGDLLLIEPSARVKGGDLVLCLSKEHIVLGKLHCHPEIYLIQPLSHEIPPFAFGKRDRKKIKLFRISEIKLK
jgi:transcriptional regulator with XRE-family HTH domain